MHLIKRAIKPGNAKLISCMMALILFMSTMLGLAHPNIAYAKTEESDPADHFEVWLVDPDNENNEIKLLNYSIAELEQMPQVQRAYSSIDSYPAPVFTAARGIDLIDFLDSNNFDQDSISGFQFRPTDYDAGNCPPYTGKYLDADILLDLNRYYFPQIAACREEYWDKDKENPSNPNTIGYWKDGSDQYTRVDQTPVRPMLGIVSYQSRGIATDAGTGDTGPRFDLMDGTTTLRLCYGQKDPGECITWNYLKWTYKMWVFGRLLPIPLTADSSDNRVGNPVEITFPDNKAWQNGITVVKVNGNPLTNDQYIIAAGKITIAANVFPADGDYTVRVTSGFQDSTVTQEIVKASASDPLMPPALTSDSSDNSLGNPVDITFPDDEAWRSAFTDIKVGEDVLGSDKFTREAGKITIDASVFTSVGPYIITIRADGYGDAIVQQQIVKHIDPVTLDSIKITKPANKLTYDVGDVLDVSGLEVTGYFSDDTSKAEPVTSSDISGFDSSAPASNQMLAITVDGKTTSYLINITKPVEAEKDQAINISQDTPLTITVPDGVANTQIKYSHSSPLPFIKVTSGQVDMTIPGGTTVSGSDTIQLPEVKPSSNVNIVGAQSVDLVVEVGSGTDEISFDKPVRLVLKGQGSKSVGCIDNAGQFQSIRKLGSLNGLTGENDADAADIALENEKVQAGAVTSGADLIIWTKHFTDFVAYTESTSSPSEPPTVDHFIEETVSLQTATGEPVISQVIGLRGGILKTKGAIFNFPTNVVSEKTTVTITKLGNNIPSLPEGFKLLGDAYEIASDKSIDFTKPFTITLSFDLTSIDKNKYDVGIYGWVNNQWKALDQMNVDMTDGNVGGQAKCLGQFAVLATPVKTNKELVQKENPSTQEPLKSFNDIAGHWAEESINELVAMGAIKGYPDGSFKPDNIITRAEFATVLVNAFKLKADEGRVFSDTAGHWARDSIGIATVHGITSGYDESDFGPDDAITREQMAVMIVKAAGLKVGEGKTFADSAQIDDWAMGSVAAASDNSILTGYPNNTFGPNAKATRAEAATAITKALQILTHSSNKTS